MLTGQLGRLPFAAETTSSSSSGARGGFASGQRFWSASNNRQGTQPQWPTRPAHGKLSLHAATVLAESETRNFNSSNKRHNQPELQVSLLQNITMLVFPHVNPVDASQALLFSFRNIFPRSSFMVFLKQMEAFPLLYTAS